MFCDCGRFLISFYIIAGFCPLTVADFSLDLYVLAELRSVTEADLFPFLCVLAELCSVTMADFSLSLFLFMSQLWFVL